MTGTAFNGGSSSGQARPIYVVNQSKSVSDTELGNDIPAFQKATETFERYWGGNVKFVVVKSKADVPKKAWYVTVEDDADIPGALGYHDYLHGQPFARVFAKTSIDNGDAWTIVFMHEVDEMLADPYINRLALANNTAYLVEVGDPVESDVYAYTIKNAAGKSIKISDFVYPQWYDPTSSGPYDYTHNVKQPLQVLLQGYVSWWTPTGWQQLFNAKPPLEG